MLPADILSWPIVEHLRPGNFRDEVRVGLISYLTFPLFDSCTILLAFYLLLELQFSSTAAALGALGLFFCTTFLPYAQVQQENTLMFFSLIGGFLGCLIWFRTDKILSLCLASFCLGWGLLVRLPCFFDAFIVVLHVLILIARDRKSVKEKIQRATKFVIMFGIFYVPFIAVDRFYQWIRFGSFTSTYYGIWAAQARALDPSLPASYPFSTPFFDGLTGFLFSPDKSIFLFNPLLILATGLCIRYRKDLPTGFCQFVCLLWLLLIVQICFYARDTFWTGDTAWGPRYVITECMAIAFLAIPAFVRAYPSITSRLEKLVCEALIAISCFIQIIAVLFDDNLELAQEAAFHLKYIIVWQRFVNAISILTGTFRSSGLDPGLEAAGNQKWDALAFMPWRTAGEIPPIVTNILQFAWLFALFLFIAILLSFFAQLRHKSIAEDPTLL